MKRLKNKLIIFLGLATTVFVLLFFFSQSLVSSMSKKNVFPFSQKNYSSGNSIKPEELLKNYQQKEFITPDGSFKIEGLSGWILIKEEEFLKKVVLKNFPEKYNLKLLFVAQKIENNKIANLILSEGIFDGKESGEKIIETIKEATEKNEIQMEILRSETNDKETLFEAKYGKIGQANSFSKEKIVLFNKEENHNIYIVSFYALEKDWESFKPEVETILDSAHLVD